MQVLNGWCPVTYSLISVFSKQLTVNKNYWWLDSNPGTLDSEDLAVSIVPLPTTALRLIGVERIIWFYLTAKTSSSKSF